MKKQYFKCTLKTDIVVNASLATEGNMTTLDYIPGSNFLGIVAGSLYKKNELTQEKLFDIFHSGKVSFGDALISKNNQPSYAIPFSLFQDKLNKGLGEEKVWVHHLLPEERPKNEKEEYIQLKQQRGGFLNANKDYVKSVKKQFSLKSAHNREERRSAEGKMFGFESIKKGQVFIFSVISEDDKYADKVSNVLEGNHRIGKSKTAQFGQVFIEKIYDANPVKSEDSENNQLVIYAESNLCFFNELGQSTFQPKQNEFGDINGEINWNLSQIRTYSYSPWNTQRNTTNTQRDVIQKGSVIVIDLKGDVDAGTLKTQVGEYAAEGLGRVIYNPEFLKADKDGIWSFKLNKEKEEKKEKEPRKIADIKTSTGLGRFLLGKLETEEAELNIGKAVIDVMETKNNPLTDKDITPSQWGAIRTKATNANSINELISVLFGDENLKGKEKDLSGYLTHGVAAERVWDKNRGARRITLEKVINDNREYGTKFVARLAADMAKLNKEEKK